MTFPPDIPPDPKTTLPEPSEWRDLAEELLADYDLTDWEIDFCQDFLDRGFPEPTDRMKDVFRDIAEKYDLELPE